jgi:hypothetical protein
MSLFISFNETFYILNDEVYIKTYNIIYGIVKYKNILTEKYKKQLYVDRSYFLCYLGYITTDEYIPGLKVILNAYYISQYNY